jgi:hypothetical protein
MKKLSKTMQTSGEGSRDSGKNLVKEITEIHFRGVAARGKCNVISESSLYRRSADRFI